MNQSRRERNGVHDLSRKSIKMWRSTSSDHRPSQFQTYLPKMVLYGWGGPTTNEYLLISQNRHTHLLYNEDAGKKWTHTDSPQKDRLQKIAYRKTDDTGKKGVLHENEKEISSDSCLCIGVYHEHELGCLCGGRWWLSGAGKRLVRVGAQYGHGSARRRWSGELQCNIRDECGWT